jgi:hypothetical protein
MRRALPNQRGAKGEVLTQNLADREVLPNSRRFLELFLDRWRLLPKERVPI